ncbi:hypothetical protein niasHT_030373 [Heterodera trifolii]|uniref:Uncharacterized protein n=1 Tax=Heterodera trifolii TaxID=157864 RepID=A0ABD2KP78_9BILA
MCEAGTNIMEILGKEPNDEDTENANEQFKTMYRDASMNNKKFQVAFEVQIGIYFMTTNAYIDRMMKKMENGDELKQLFVQNNPCDESKLKVKKTKIAYERIFGMIEMIRSINGKSKGKKNADEVII